MIKAEWQGGTQFVLVTRDASSGANRGLFIWWDGKNFTFGHPEDAGRADYHIKREEMVEFARAALGLADPRSDYWFNQAAREAGRVRRLERDIEESRAVAVQQKQRAETAEERLAGVEAALSNHPKPVCEKHEPGDVVKCGWKKAVADVHAALADDPAFALPTEAGVRFEAKDWEGRRIVFRTVRVSDRVGDILYEYEDSGSLWRAESIMDEMSDHRLIEEDGA